MSQNTLTRPVWAEINLDALAYNMRAVRKCIKPSTLASAVIKADGYGHGAVQIAGVLLDNGADRLAVATLSEAVQLRRVYGDTEIMILGYTPNENAEEVIGNGLIQTVYHIEQAVFLNQKAMEMNRKLKVHVKLDTGMRRIGMAITEETVAQIIEMTTFSHLIIEGLFTHFAVADETDKAFTHTQVERFKWVADRLEAQGVSIPIKHVANSATIIDCPEYQFDMVRAGIMLYGLYPSKDVNHKAVSLKEVMSLRAQISHVKYVEAGEGISYGLIYKTCEKEQIATLPLGYADGFARGYTGLAKAIVKGKIKPVIGRICMDQCMLSVTGIDVNVGDVVTLFGTEGTQVISIDEYADMIGTINYEVVCMISKRVLRVYKKEDKIVAVIDYLR
ncbi:alanine racemase [Fusibacter sp. 3D3]|uniref:alanine racemase n=1 Tax=Fusibacter sp. 3D3 TaxID=1048380 RepID=UPI000853A6C6|nr:alanine racemase [Fusibacter sp. 3D3]GAU77999.1 alanine racemase [Fusibacter sp. 3D3]